MILLYTFHFTDNCMASFVCFHPFKGDIVNEGNNSLVTEMPDAGFAVADAGFVPPDSSISRPLLYPFLL